MSSDFYKSSKPIVSINYYLHSIWSEVAKRNYNFDKRKFIELKNIDLINVTSGQIEFEKEHLLKKLKLRDEKKYNEILNIDNYEIHPFFN